MSDLVLQCQDLCKYFDEGPERVDVLKSVNFDLRAGEFVSIVGNSGSGKTTLLHMLSGLDTPSSGDIVPLYSENRFNNFRHFLGKCNSTTLMMNNFDFIITLP